MSLLSSTYKMSRTEKQTGCIADFTAFSQPPTSNLFSWWMASEAYDAADGGGSKVTGIGNSIYSLKDMSGNGRHQNQATAGYRPILASGLNGFPSAAFDGSDDFVGTASVTLDRQATTIYLVIKQISWTDTDYLFGLATGTTLRAQQLSSSPNIANNSISATGGLSIGSFGMIAWVFGASQQELKINNDSSATGSAGSAGTESASFEIASQNSAARSNIEVAESLIFSEAHALTSGTGLATRQYLNSKYNLGLSL